jgi:hypothetical protein
VVYLNSSLKRRRAVLAYGERYIRLAPKKPFFSFGSATDPATTAKRRTEIQTYLQALVANPDVSCHVKTPCL